MTNVDRLIGAATSTARRVSVRPADGELLNRLSTVQAEIVQRGKDATRHLRELHGRLSGIQERWELSPQSKAEGMKLEWTRFDAEVAGPSAVRMRELVAERADLLASLTASHRQPGGHTEELQRQAAWSRMQAALDQAGNVKQQPVRELLEAAAKVGDTASLEAARRELPAYLARHSEPLPADLAVWLDVIAGPPETMEARTLERSLAAEDLTVSQLAVSQLARAAQHRVIPDVMPWPSGEEGTRVTAVTDNGAEVLR